MYIVYRYKHKQINYLILRKLSEYLKKQLIYKCSIEQFYNFRASSFFEDYTKTNCTSLKIV